MRNDRAILERIQGHVAEIHVLLDDIDSQHEDVCEIAVQYLSSWERVQLYDLQRSIEGVNNGDND